MAAIDLEAKSDGEPRREPIHGTSARVGLVGRGDPARVRLGCRACGSRLVRQRRARPARHRRRGSVGPLTARVYRPLVRPWRTPRGGTTRGGPSRGSTGLRWLPLPQFVPEPLRPGRPRPGRAASSCSATKGSADRPFFQSAAGTGNRRGPRDRPLPRRSDRRRRLGRRRLVRPAGGHR